MATELKKVKLADLIPTKNNPRKITPEDLEKLKKSVREFPKMLEAREIVVDENMRILGGHQRVKALQANGETETTVKIVTGWSEEEKERFIIQDNLQNGEWDQEILSTWDQEKLEGWGMELLPEPEEIEKEIEEPETPEAEDGPTICQPGDIWQLGEHRLMCGDSTKPEDVQKLMAGEQADLWLTDPPYNVNYEGATKDKLTIQNDKMGDSAFHNFLFDAFAAANGVMKAGCPFYIWHADSESYNFRGAMKENGFTIRECLIWNKSSMVLGRQDYQWKHEPCLYGWKEGAHYFTPERNLTTVIDDFADIDKMTRSELKAALKEMLNGGVPTTIIDCAKPSRSEEHPTMKPVKLFAYLMKNSSKPGERVLDTFAGSGTTIMAAEQLNRKAYCMELDPKYCDVIIKRWENFTGRKAEKING